MEGQKVDSTWLHREVPVLRRVYEAEEGGAYQLSSGEISEATGLPEPVVLRTMRSLAEEGYIEGGKIGQLRGRLIYYSPRLRERGRREIGQWPADSFDALVAILSKRIEDESSPEAKSKLQAFRDALLGMGRDIAVERNWPR